MSDDPVLAVTQVLRTEVERASAALDQAAADAEVTAAMKDFEPNGRFFYAPEDAKVRALEEIQRRQAARAAEAIAPVTEALGFVPSVIEHAIRTAAEPPDVLTLSFPDRAKPSSGETFAAVQFEDTLRRQLREDLAGGVSVGEVRDLFEECYAHRADDLRAAAKAVLIERAVLAGRLRRPGSPPETVADLMAFKRRLAEIRADRTPESVRALQVLVERAQKLARVAELRGVTKPEWRE